MNKEIEKELAAVRAREKELLAQQDAERPNLQFRCGCSGLHKIKDCALLIEHYYVPPSGCTDGAYWTYSEAQIVCPTNNVRNRLMFPSRNLLPWDKRDHYGTAEHQFLSLFKKHFKEVVDIYGDDKRGWWNNYYIDSHHDKFGIHVAGIDYKELDKFYKKKPANKAKA